MRTASIEMLADTLEVMGLGVTPCNEGVGVIIGGDLFMLIERAPDEQVAHEAVRLGARGVVCLPESLDWLFSRVAQSVAGTEMP